MRKVLFKKYVPAKYEADQITKIKGTGCWSDFVNEGFFHTWADDYDDGYGETHPQFTYAIVETLDGTIECVLPKNLKFVTPIKQSEVK